MISIYSHLRLSFPLIPNYPPAKNKPSKFNNWSCTGTVLSNCLPTFLFLIKFSDDDFQLRSRDSHARQCHLVAQDPSLSTVYGVKQDSILNRSQYFHVVDGLEIDVMHDQLEGVLPLQLKMLLAKYIMIDKLFTLQILNDRIGSFDYGPTDVKKQTKHTKGSYLVIRFCISQSNRLVIEILLI